jgi:glycosyltransferase involved in cell wall biosynthesis
MINCQPKVSVLMPVYNGELYIRQAIDSILNQTFSDFEFIIIDDCSTDSSVAIINSYTDPRIRLITNLHNKGVSAVANQGNSLANAEYIARLDCDDVSFPQRLAKQVEYLDRHPEVAVIGSQCIYIDTEGKVTDHQPILCYPVEPSSIRWRASYECPILNSTSMYRKQILANEVGKYDENKKFGEDYEVWLKVLLNNYQGANLAEVLVQYRVNPKSLMHSTSVTDKIDVVLPMQKDYLDKLIPGYDREKEIVVNFFATLSANIAAETSTAMDTLRTQYVSIYLDGKMTKDLSMNMARERAFIGYRTFPVDRWQATNLMLKAIWQYPGLTREISLVKVIYLILFGASGRQFFRSLLPKSN